MNPLIMALLKYAGIPVASTLALKLLGGALTKKASNNPMATITGLSGSSVPGASPIGSALSGIGNAVQTAGGHLLDTGGRLVQAGGLSAGALASALSHAPKHLVNAMQPQREQEIYGNPFSAGANIIGELGDAAGVGVSALTGAVGTSISDIGNSLKLQAKQDQLTSRSQQYADQLNRMNLTPGQWDVLGRMISAGNIK